LSFDAAADELQHFGPVLTVRIPTTITSRDQQNGGRLEGRLSTIALFPRYAAIEFRPPRW
jgi:hypothetical protein